MKLYIEFIISDEFTSKFCKSESSKSKNNSNKLNSLDIDYETYLSEVHSILMNINKDIFNSNDFMKIKIAEENANNAANEYMKFHALLYSYNI